jgi:cytochrome c oxidase subunit III
MTPRVEGPYPTRAAVQGPYSMGLMTLLATITMLFSAFVAALLMRRIGGDWEPLRVPAVLWVNTLVLALSSALVEVARSAVRQGLREGAERRLALAAAFGVFFLLGQLGAWIQLQRWGFLLRTGPHVAFFYVVSVVHAIHVVAGVVVLLWTLRRLAAGAYTAADHRGLTHAGIFWHFLGGTWLYLFSALLLL